MFRVRTATTASGAIAVQVIYYRYRKRVIVKHIGSAHSKEDLASLKKIANQWIEKETHQQELFPIEKTETSLPFVSVDKLRNLGFYYTFAYETLTKLLQFFNLSGDTHRLLLDLVLIRIIKPASKVESLRLLVELFGIYHKRAAFYKCIPAIVRLKTIVEEHVITLARTQFSFDFHIVFYDVTTLYFESFTEDEDENDLKDKLNTDGNIIEKGVTIKQGLRKNGFSKDNKPNQP